MCGLIRAVGHHAPFASSALAALAGLPALAGLAGLAALAGLAGLAALCGDVRLGVCRGR
jgi:hypothetical protein